MAPTAQPQAKRVRVTGVLASLLTVIVAVAAFCLSFSALSELARMTGVFPADLSWLFAVVIDGFMIQATLCLVDATATGDAKGKRYHWIMLTVFSAISVAGNFFHALLVSHSDVMAPWVAAIIAIVAPIALLSSSHGLVVYLWHRPDTPAHAEPEQATWRRWLATWRRWLAARWAGLRGRTPEPISPPIEDRPTLASDVHPEPLPELHTSLVQPAHPFTAEVATDDLTVIDIAANGASPDPVPSVDAVRQAQVTKAIALIRDEQHTHQQAADKIGVSRSTVTRWWNAFAGENTGEVDLVAATTP